MTHCRLAISAQSIPTFRNADTRMKRGAIILALGLFLGAVAYAGFYFAGMAPHRAMLESQVPELAWLKKEYGLRDAEFKRVEQLHDAFKTECVALCGRIDSKNSELEELLATADKMTPEIEAKLSEAAELHVQCQKNMLRHFFEVSRNMPPDQGRRYLAWVREKTCLPEGGMQGERTLSETGHEHGHR